MNHHRLFHVEVSAHTHSPPKYYLRNNWKGQRVKNHRLLQRKAHALRPDPYNRHIFRFWTESLARIWSQKKISIVLGKNDK